MFYLLGINQIQISVTLQKATGAEYRLSQSMINYDIKKIKQSWLKESIDNFYEAQNIQLAKLDLLEYEYWQSWINGKDKNNPNPRFLEGVQKCIEIRCKLLGLNDILQNKHLLIRRETKSECEIEDKFQNIIDDLNPLLEKVLQEMCIS